LKCLPSCDLLVERGFLVRHWLATPLNRATDAASQRAFSESAAWQPNQNKEEIHMKKKHAIWSVGTLCAGLLAGTQSADAGVTEAELKALADALPGGTQVRVLGLASGTSEWNFLTKPFWSEKVPALSKGKIKVNLSSITELGVSGFQMVRLVKAGIADIADPVAGYASQDVKETNAMDLSGVATNWEEINKAINAYAPILDGILQKRMGVTILTQWPATGQVFWCKSKIQNAADVKGKKIRIFNSTMADFISGLGGVPVNMPFAEMTPALQRGVIDCGVTGTASGNTAKLFEVADYLFALNVGWAPQIRIVNKRWFSGLDPKVQEWLKKASEYFHDSMAMVIQKRNHNMGLWCSSGSDKCDLSIGGFTKASMKLNRPKGAAAAAAIKKAVESSVLPAFAENCDADCIKGWNTSVGKALGLTMPGT
jgi:TRAP-type transport system periplasmic protein